MMLLFAAQVIALLVLLARLASGAKRDPPVAPATAPVTDTTVSVLVPTLNEAERIGPLLRGLALQGAPMIEAIVVDSNSTDDTRELVSAAMAKDPRIRLLADPPLPGGWIGKVWALQHGLSQVRGEWVLGLDADTDPEPGLVAAVVRVARERDLDVASFSPRFAGQSAGERFVHPSLLLTLVYRGGAGTGVSHADRIMANGQCFLARRDVLEQHGGYAPARASFADDVTLARFLAHRGVRVGFLDGSRLFRVRSYGSLGEMWREWGRSLDLRDASHLGPQMADLALLAAVQGIPVPLLLFALTRGLHGPFAGWLVGLNGILVAIRAAMLFAVGGSYEQRGLPYWLSPLTDPFAFLRILWSSLRRPRVWRGRRYAARGVVSKG